MVDSSKKVIFKQRFEGREGESKVFWRENTQAEQPVQRPWGRSMSGVFQELQGGQCVQIGVSKVDRENMKSEREWCQIIWAFRFCNASGTSDSLIYPFFSISFTSCHVLSSFFRSIDSMVNHDNRVLAHITLTPLLFLPQSYLPGKTPTLVKMNSAFSVPALTQQSLWVDTLQMCECKIWVDTQNQSTVFFSSLRNHFLTFSL